MLKGDIMKSITVNASIPYQVIIERNGIANIGALLTDIAKSKNVVIVTDDIVEKLYAQIILSSLQQAGFKAKIFSIPHGENSKCLEILAQLYEYLSQNEMTRKDTLIALGGGVVGDLTGFAAATYLRGIRFVQIPTTFLSQIDASVGGKTAINIKSGKNLVGAFHQPILVLCDPNTLNTLPNKILSDGFAEAIKYGVIASINLYKKILNYKGLEEIDEIIYECIQIKKRLVEEDEFDNGNRMLLNFGHTLGHAIECAYNYQKFSHGQAVAMGMFLITKLSEKRQLTNQGQARSIQKLLEKFHFPYETVCSEDEFIHYCLRDKKRRGEKITVVLLHKIGDAYLHTFSIEEFKTFIRGIV